MQEILQKWYLPVLKNYKDFYGRSGLREFWYFTAINFVIGLLFAILGQIIGIISIFGYLYGLFVLIPGLAVSIRRLHDTGKSGWLLLLGIIPVLGAVILIYLCAQKGDPGPNEYGPQPVEPAGQISL